MYTFDPSDGLTPKAAAVRRHSAGSVHSAELAFASDGGLTAYIVTETGLDRAALFPIRAAGTPREVPRLPDAAPFLPRPGVVVSVPGEFLAFWREDVSVHTLIWRSPDRTAFETACKRLVRI